MQVFKIYIYISILFIIPFNCAAYERILPMAPNLVEVVYELGLGDKICGIPDFTSYPPEVLLKPHAGSYLYPSYETILRLDPDIIIIQGEFLSLSGFAEKNHIGVLNVNMDSLASIYSGIIHIGKKLHVEQRSFSLVADIKGKLMGLVSKNSKPVNVFICIGRIPGSLKQISTPGSRSFISELLKFAGGRNIFEDIDKNYITVSKEEIIKRNPDIIFDLVSSHDKELSARLIWEKMRYINAVKNGHIFFPKEKFLLIPGPRIVDTAEVFKKYIARASEAE